MLSDFGAYHLWMVVNAHFKSDYNAITYKWRLSRLTPEHLENRNDKKIFASIAKKYQTKEKLVDVLVANFCKKGQLDWIGELDEDVYEDWAKRISSLDYNFKEDISKLLENVKTPEDFSALIYNKETDKSEIFEAMLVGKLSMETFIMLDNLLGVMTVIDRQLQFTLLWETYKTIIRKYQYIFNALYLTPDDCDKMKKFLKSQVKSLIDSNGIPKKVSK